MMFPNSRLEPNRASGRMPKATYALIFIIAAAVSATLAYGAFLGTLPSRLLQVIEAADQIKLEVSLAQIAAGAKHSADAKPNETEVWSHYERAENLVGFLLSDGRGRLSLDTPGFENLLLLVRKQISHCRQLTERQFLTAGRPAALADINRNIARELARLLSMADEIHVEAGIAARETIAHFQRLLYSLILATLILAFIAGAVIYRFERRRASDYGIIQGQNLQLQAAEQQLRATNQQLRASNQQLQATEQQLRASNQQFHASNQQLRATEQQLRASNEQLHAGEQALRASESRYRALFANMSEGMALYCAVYDGSGKTVDCLIQDVNRQFEEIFSVPREKAVGRLVSEVFGESLTLDLPEYRTVADTGRTLVLERSFPALDRAFRVCIYSPEHGSCAVVFTDITARKKAAAADRREALRLETLMQITNFRAPDTKGLLEQALEKILCMLDCGTGFICDYYGKTQTFAPRSFKTRKESMAPNEWVTEGFAGRVLTEAVRRRQPVVLNDFCGDAQGDGVRSSRHRLLIVPVLRSGRPVAVACVADRETDFEDHDANEFALLMDSVWKILELRNEQEERSRLETRIQKLESVGLLAGGIAHDFNNLLTAVLANVTLAKIQAREGEPIEARLDEIESASGRAQGLTQQLLTFAKGGKPVKKLVCLEPIIRDSAALALSGSNVQCQLRFADDLCSAEIDEGQISQVMNNLIINAAQAMPAGGTVTVEAENTHINSDSPVPVESGRYVRVSVVDKGIGILPEHFERIFDPYFTTKQKGSGLGLTISHSVVAGHRGHIAVDSRIGAGTAFHVYLPASCESVSPPSGMKQLHLEGRGSVLIMDDEDMVREICAEILKRFGYEVESVPDGQEAVKRYEQRFKQGKGFDAVILDLTVPGGMGGREAVQEILKIDPDAKVLVSSGYSNDPVMADYAGYGFRGLVPKPYSMQSLSDAVNALLGPSDRGA
jgi:signal transduction histidine kinase/CheY-like chemotaxis protein/PAS domain-containing protein